MEKERNTNKKNKKKTRKLAKFFKIVLLIFLGLVILTGVAGAGVTLAIIKTAPPLDVNAILTFNEPSTIYDSNDNYIDDVNSEEKRTVISINDVPKDLVNAFVSIEDERFYKHNGVDFKRVAGVIYIDILNKLRGIDELEGASTITQQLVRNAMLSTREKEPTFLDSAKRKIREMYLAVKLEKEHLTKDQILEGYLNTVPLGGTVYGVEAAAKYYFNKSAKDLNLIQCAYLAGVPQNPSIYNAFLASRQKDPSKYLNRTKTVLSMMLKNNYITEQQYNQAVNGLSKDSFEFVQSTNTNNSRLNYEWFTLPAIEQVKEDLKAQYNYTDEEINNLLMFGGLKIYTTMDKNLQDAAQAIIDDTKNYGSIKTQMLNGIMDPQASAVIMDYHTGEVKVIIGGRGEQPARSFNRAAFNGSKEFKKPVGSTIKPLTVYAASIDSKQATAATVVEDSPIGSEIKKQWPGWEPKNDNLKYQGYVTLREAIKKSINLVAVKQEFALGLKTGISYGEKFGLTFHTTQDKTSLASLSLGEMYDGENTLTMAAAYGTFGNGGMYTKPRLYRKVIDRRNVTILESKVENSKILSPQSAYIMYDMMKGPVSSGGTGPSARFGSMPVAGKTGTTGDKKELWFSGLTPYYSGSVWIGHDNPEPFPKGISSDTAAAIWGKIMKAAHSNMSIKEIEKPSGIVTRSVCRESGLVPTDLCSKDPRGSQVYTEMFIAGTQPTTLCDVHVEAKVNKLNGKLATEFTPKELIESRVFIKRDSKSSRTLEDQAYVLPTEMDDTKPEPVEPTPTEPEQPVENQTEQKPKDTTPSTPADTNPNNGNEMKPNSNSDNTQ
ncbi:PBP1A family penicillin-binding protein [Clostridium sp. SYSU_GA19001]|uniref:transglycosylase domain-containing protein n=1 Tax=Clostridium caldaquaticum TaxID=2940653 RepID=UPI002076D981|nr:PBP1A family penicillin-binding protein [Clostridium caldaquaticum]MCM8711303.1 PBP1A family penicillin-binding protein [Clostridium caldaquaticum]